MLNKSEILISKSEISTNVQNSKLFRESGNLNFKFVSNFKFSVLNLMDYISKSNMVYLVAEKL